MPENAVKIDRNKAGQLRITVRGSAEVAKVDRNRNGDLRIIVNDEKWLTDLVAPARS